MRVLLSTIGSRGDVQPVAALAVELRALGQEVRVCAPPDFAEWIGTFGIPFVPVTDVRSHVFTDRPWADLGLPDDEPDCLSIGEVNHQALLPRVAAVVHHGGAGTPTAAARAGAPQVVVPQGYDQHYWAQRVHDLGIGTAHPGATPTAESLTAALDRSLDPAVAARARVVASAVRSDGAKVAAQRLVAAGRATTRA